MTLCEIGAVAHVDLVKIDTESTESDVIGGMLETIGHSRPNIFCEILPEADNLTGLTTCLRSLGYQFHQLGPDGPRQRTEIVPGAGEWRNYLFTPA